MNLLSSMKLWLYTVTRQVRFALHPLPTESRYAQKFFSLPLEALLFVHIEEIIGVVLREVRVTAPLGFSSIQAMLSERRFFRSQS